MLEGNQILKKVVSQLNTVFDLPVYALQEKEGFKMPCFYLQISQSFFPATKFFMSVNLSVIINYFSESADQVTFGEINKKIFKLFREPLHVEDRHLNLLNFKHSLAGEEQDILQFELNYKYFDSMDYDPDEGYIAIEDINLTLKNDNQ